MSFGTRFLADASQFPARIAGSPCGDQSITFGLGGGSFLFNGLTEEQCRALSDWTAAGNLMSPASPSHPNIGTRVFSAEPSEFIDVDFGGGEYTYDRDYASNMVRLCGWNFMALLQWRPELSVGIWVRPTDNLIRYGIFENILRVLVAYHLASTGGVLLHSAAVATEEGAHVFFGPSGAGKTTISRLASEAGFTVLSDDLNVLRVRGGGVVCQKVPFAGDFGLQPGGKHTAEYPVLGLHRLRKGNEHRLRVLSRAQGLAGLLAASPFVNSDPYRVSGLWANLENVVTLNEVSELTFRPDSGFLDMLRQARVA